MPSFDRLRMAVYGREWAHRPHKFGKCGCSTKELSKMPEATLLEELGGFSFPILSEDH